MALGAFLRAHRERLEPSRAEIAVSRRRRTPGLRREEVAQRAGVGVAWYTWLEQGRDIHPSREALTFIADALELDSAAREHLLTLAGQTVAAPVDLAAVRVPPSLPPILAALEPNPAYINDLRWNVVAWNAAADRVFGFGALPEEERNGLLLMFTRPGTRHRMRDWERIATSMVAAFRLNIGPYMGDPSVESLLARLRTSDDFVRLWKRQDVSVRRVGRKAMHHPKLGELVFEHQAFQVIDAPALRLVVYTPVAPRPEVR
ncbi:helix-turn-helix transcriptional regulator [Pendulispora albinea]|uniref:Helix-turn-helix transcriptional regulator n=1 Tax=Pendulispora albinea TaxID=2741071 RepID=A0ABZ2M1U6_9BACT